MNPEDITRKIKPTVRSNKNFSKIFCIGSNKSGTTSLAATLEIYGYSTPNQISQEMEISKQTYLGNYLPLKEFVNKYEVFQDFMSKDSRSFSKKNVIFAANKLWSNHLLTEKDYKSLEKMAEDIEEKILSQEERDIPDEFCDPLMASEITNPVLLPGTDTIMDKSVISRQ